MTLAKYGKMKLRIVIITQDEPLYIPLVIEKILKERDDIFAVIAVPPYVKSSSFLSTIKLRLQTYGIDYVVKVSFIFIISKILDRLNYVRPFSIKRLSKLYDVKYIFTANVNDDRFLNEFEKIDPDLIISISPPQVFKKRILSIPRLGIINVHGALLPGYRGLQPSFWVLANEERITGVTIHYMNEKLDEGGIILQEKVDIDKDDTQFSLIYKTKKTGAKLILASINLIERGHPRTENSNSDAGSYYSFPTREDVKRFRQRKRKFVVWKDIFTLLRGFDR
jgi:methionyl-tRNA formyltransferase